MIRPGALTLLAALLMIGCFRPPEARTTFLSSVDLLDMTDRMAESFAADPVIGRRNPDDDRWVVSIDRTANRTNEIIPDREKWLYVGRLRAILAESGVGADRGVIWVVPPERWPAVSRELDGDEAGPRLSPTHVLSAEFHALTNTSGAGRTDAYLCAFQLSDLRSGRLVWEDAWEVKRAAAGRTYD